MQRTLNSFIRIVLLYVKGRISDQLMTDVTTTFFEMSHKKVRYDKTNCLKPLAVEHMDYREGNRIFRM